MTDVKEACFSGGTVDVDVIIDVGNSDFFGLAIKSPKSSPKSSSSAEVLESWVVVVEDRKELVSSSDNDAWLLDVRFSFEEFLVVGAMEEEKAP